MAFSQEIVQIKRSIVIDEPIEKVCAFVTNPMNDHLWRSEVNSMVIEGDDLEVGVLVIEDAWIGLRRHFITKTRIEALNCPHEGLFITTEDNPYYLKSHRSFEMLGENQTRFTYDLEFGVEMIPATLRLPLKPDFVSKMYGIKMWSYLKKLQRIIK
jgi:hypothetical protein